MTRPPLALHASWLGLLALALSGAGGPTPAPLMPEADECAQCRMAVQDERLAAEWLGTGGEALKFDELGCLIAYVKSHRLRRAAARAVFVKDFRARTWLPLERATLVRSQYPTPMRYGMLAFSSPAEARKLDAKHAGKLTTWRALTGQD